jgi:hypothetical protein
MHFYKGQYPYIMEHDGQYHEVFCLEYTEYFKNHQSYTVESVGDYATGGGGGIKEYWDEEDTYGDPVSDITKWIYAAYKSGILTGYTPFQVQQTVWHMEGEGGFDYYTGGMDQFSFDDSGWSVFAVNIITVNEKGVKIRDNQSQLIGTAAPVPEPASLMLLGTGLLSVGAVTRRKFQK